MIEKQIAEGERPVTVLSLSEDGEYLCWAKRPNAIEKRDLHPRDADKIFMRVDKFSIPIDHDVAMEFIKHQRLDGRFMGYCNMVYIVSAAEWQSLISDTQYVEVKRDSKK